MPSCPKKSPYRFQTLSQLVWMDTRSRMKVLILGRPSGEGREPHTHTKKNPKQTTKKLSVRYKGDLPVWKEVPTLVCLHSPGECNCGSQRVWTVVHPSVFPKAAAVQVREGHSLWGTKQGSQSPNSPSFSLFSLLEEAHEETLTAPHTTGSLRGGGRQRPLQAAKPAQNGGGAGDDGSCSSRSAPGPGNGGSGGRRTRQRGAWAAGSEGPAAEGSVPEGLPLRLWLYSSAGRQKSDFAGNTGDQIIPGVLR